MPLGHRLAGFMAFSGVTALKCLRRMALAEFSPGTTVGA
jgi:hypothetical protein